MNVGANDSNRAKVRYMPYK